MGENEEDKVVLEDDQLKQMGDMNGDVLQEPPVEDIPAIDEPPKEDTSIEEPQNTEEPPIEDKGEEPPKVEDKGEEDPLEALKKENESLRSTIEQVMRDMGAPPKPKEKTPEEIKAEEEANKNRGPVILPFFKKDEDIDNAFKTVDSANRFMTSVVATAVEVIGKQIPTIASRIADQQITLKMATKEFFDNNSDLLKYKEYCGFIANKLASDNPDWTISKLMEEVGTKTREALRIKGQISSPNISANNDSGNVGGNPPSVRRKGPALPPTGGGGRKGGATQLSGMEKELQDMIKATVF